MRRPLPRGWPLLASALAVAGGTLHGQTQWGNFSGESTGKVEIATQEMLHASKAICEARGKTQKIEGSEDLNGQYTNRFYVSGDQLAVYSEKWVLVLADPRDPCGLRIKKVREARFESSDNDVVTRISVDLDRGTAHRTVRKGRIDLLRPDASRTRADLLAAGYRPAGGATYGGYQCDLLRRVSPDADFDVCLLNDRKAPAGVQGIPLHDAMTVRERPEKGSRVSVQQIDFSAPIDPSLLQVPNGIAIKDSR